MEKKCPRCRVVKPVEEFHGRVKPTICKPCGRLARAEYIKRNPERIAEQQQRHAEKNRERNRRYHAQNRLRIRERKRDFYHNNPDKRPRHANLCLRQSFHLAHNLRARLRNALRGDYKTGSAVELLGCSIEHLRKHLEGQFEEGMNWGNYGREGWHIDHIIPLCTVDLTNPQDLKKVLHFTNLRPLWREDNLSRRRKNFIPLKTLSQQD